MPIYNYNCSNEKCKASFTFFHLTKDEPAICPKCSAGNPEKTISTDTSHQLKGGGWYSDGYSGKRKP